MAEQPHDKRPTKVRLLPPPRRRVFGGRGVVDCTARGERAGESSILSGHPNFAAGCGSMAGHLARNQVHAGSIPAALTDHGSVLLGERSVSKADEQRSNRCRPATRTEYPEVDNLSACWKAPPNGRQRVPKTRVVAQSPRGSNPPPSSHLRTVVRAARTRSSKPERRVRLSHGAQRQEVSALARFPVVQWQNTRPQTGGRRFDFSQGPERCERAPRPRMCPSSIAGDAAVL